MEEIIKKLQELLEVEKELKRMYLDTIGILVNITSKVVICVERENDVNFLINISSY